MGKHAIGGMRSMMIDNRNADMRRRKKAYLRNKRTAEGGITNGCKGKTGGVAERGARNWSK